MGEKSRGNWAVGWCSLKGKGCIGSCERCVRKSEWKEGKKVRREGYELCERHGQEYRQYCLACVLDPEYEGRRRSEPRTVGGKVVWVEGEL